MIIIGRKRLTNLIKNSWIKITYLQRSSERLIWKKAKKKRIQSLAKKKKVLRGLVNVKIKRRHNKERRKLMKKYVIIKLF